MSLIDLGKMILKISPVIATALLGPAGGIVAKLVADLFGADSTDPTDIMTKMQADPDHDIKLKQLEVDKGEYIANLHADSYSKEVEDRESARQREIELAKLGKSDWVPKFIDIVFVVGFFALAFIQMLPNVKIVNTTVSMMVGAIIREMVEIIRYYRGGAQKDS